MSASFYLDTQWYGGIGHHTEDLSVHVFLGGHGLGSHLHTFIPTSTTSEDVVFELPSKALPASASLAVDCFLREWNEQGKECHQLIGSTSFFLNELHATSRTLHQELYHPSSRLTQGSVACRVVFATPVAFADPEDDEWCRRNANDVRHQIDLYGSTSMKPFLNNHWTPTVPFLRNVHVPWHYDRTCVLPGFAYWLRNPKRGLQCCESWCRHRIRLALRRHDRSEDWCVRALRFGDKNACQTAFKPAMSMVLEAACSVVNSFEYISDWVPDLDGTKHYCELFGEMFLTRSGDCEDGTKAIIEIVQAFASGEWASELMQGVAKACRLYVPFAILGMVNAPTIRGGVPQRFQAHMFMNWVPYAKLKRWCTLTLDDNEWIGMATQPWMDELDVLVGEGTGHVEPNLLPYVHVNKDQRHIERHMRSVTLPPCVDRMMRPSWIDANDQKRVFYKMHVHAYTSAFIDHGIPVGAFSFVQKGRRYGVEFDDVVLGRQTFRLEPHAHVPHALLRSIQSILSLNHPLPRFEFKEQTIGSSLTRVQETKNAFHDALLPWTTATPPKRMDVWTDLYVHPSRTDPYEILDVTRTLQKLGVRFALVCDELDTNMDELSCLRIRVYW